MTLIEKGGSIPDEEGVAKDEYKKFLVRIKADMLATVDEAVELKILWSAAAAFP